jgi:hypothetical protein
LAGKRQGIWVDLEQPAGLFERGRFDGSGDGDAGVVDHDIEPAFTGEDGLYRGIDGGLFGDVEVEAAGARAGVDAVAALEQMARAGTADSGRRAGDEDDSRGHGIQGSTRGCDRLGL